MLEDDDTEATEVVDELVSILPGHSAAGTAKKLGQAVEAYDFEEALNLLDSIKVDEANA